MSSYFLNLEGVNTKEIPMGGKSRNKALDIIDNFLHLQTFDYFYKRWYNNSTTRLFTRADTEKIYNPYGYMSKIINEMVLLAPTLNNFNTSYQNKIDVLKLFLKNINWNSLQDEIYKTLETKGDFFAYWYYDEDNNIKLKTIDPKEIIEITLDRNGNPDGYTRRREYIKETIDDSTGHVVEKTNHTVTTIFKKGYIRINDSKKYKKGYKIIRNKEWEKDKIRIIHIPSMKNSNNKFSQIPAINYIDPTLLLDNITTDLRMINKLLAFPIRFLIDGSVDAENSDWGISGIININSKDSAVSSKQAKLQKQEIDNGLETIKYERDLVNKDLYKKIGLIREELEESMGSSGSSRVLAQLRLTLEKKYEKYCTNIANGFAPLFESVLRNNNVWSQRDSFITFELPELFINTSIFDELQVQNSKLALGQTTMQEELRKKGFDKDRIKQIISEINEEQALGKDDAEIKKETVATAVNGQSSQSDTMDNQFKQEKNIGGE